MADALPGGGRDVVVFRKLGDGLFLQSCADLAKLYSNVKYDTIIVDNCAMQVRHPHLRPTYQPRIFWVTCRLTVAQFVAQVRTHCPRAAAGCQAYPV